MIGLPGGWDEDLYDDKPLATAQGFQPRTEDGRPLSKDGKPLSKAAELLWRASEASRLARDAQAIEEDQGEDQLAVTPTRQVASPLEPRVALFDTAETEPLTDINRPSQGLGVFGTEEYPQGSDVEVRRWTLCAPRMLSLSSSFRASMRGGLVAQPVIDPSSGGTFRVRLLKLAPGLHCRNQSRAEPDTEHDVTDGAALLEAQLQVGFAAPSTAQNPALDIPQVPQLLLPHGAKAQALLERYLEVSGACLGSHAKEGIELLGALFGGCTIGDGKIPQWPPNEVREARNVACALSAWLARVNVRKVRRHLQSETSRSAGQRLVDLSGHSGTEASSSGLRAVYHYLTANSVRHALEELTAAAGHAATMGRAQFDRLAAIVASCGGSSFSGRPRRESLQRQLVDWRKQGVHALMGQPLWRIYCLLGGDIESVVGDSLDWRTAFGIFLWYRCPDAEEATSGAGEELADAVHHFLATVKVRGTSCGFRPAPPYAEREPRGRGASFRMSGQDQFQPVTAVEPIDLHFNIIRAAVGLVDWQNLSNFDYLTHTPRPLDVACSWHVSLLLLALFGGDATVPSFQVLTQQYCFLLELTGRWEMAVYVAQFLCNSRARNSAIYGLVQRHAGKLPDNAKLPAPAMQVPPSWVFRAKALRSELELDWPGAVTFWMQAGRAFVERALILAMAFLQGPLLVGHANNSLRRGAAEALCLATMTPPAHWLLSMLDEHEASLEMHDEAWAHICRLALAFMRKWAQAKDSRHDSADLVHLYWRCETLKKHLLGVPW